MSKPKKVDASQGLRVLCDQLDQIVSETWESQDQESSEFYQKVG